MPPRAAAKSEDTLPIAEPVVETLTYVPGEGDPASTKWGGHTFHANTPKEIRGHTEGTRAEQINAQIIELARNNPFFRVGNERAPRREVPKEPTTPAEYKAYFVGWLKTFHPMDAEGALADGLVGRFARDRKLHESCEIGADDFAFISDLFMPRLHEFAKADGLDAKGVAAVWLRHGYNQLPW